MRFLLLPPGRRYRTFLAVALAAALGTVLGAAGANAVSLPPCVPLAALCYQLNETSGPMLDSSPNHVNSIKIMPGITRDGAAYHFNGTGSVIVPNRPPAQVGVRNFKVTVQLHLDPLPVCENDSCSQNFFQKGGLSMTRGQWKLEMSGTHVHCRIFGSLGEASVWYFGVGKKLTGNSPSYWHTLSCARVGDVVTLTVDGLKTKTSVETVPTGNVTTTRNVTLGGKGTGCGTDCDYMHGYLNYATLEYLGA
jgi:hypothetical protein